MNSNTQVAFWHETPKIKRASFRLRCLNVVKALKKMGHDVSLFEKGMTPKLLILSRRYDSKTIEHAKFLRQNYGTLIGLDLCDNHFYYETNRQKFEERKKRLVAAVEMADFVIASSEALKEEIQKHTTQKEIVVIGDAVEPPYFKKNIFSLNFWRGFFGYLLLAYKLRNTPKENRLIWFGNHGTSYASGGMEDLNMILKTLEEIAQKRDITLTIVSNSRKKYRALFSKSKIKSHYLTWNIYFISKVLQMHSISLIPAKLNPFTACKTNNRVATSLLHGLAVCCSPIPSYKEIVECIHDDGDWLWAINKYLDKKNKEEQIKSGLSKLQKYSENAIFALWSDLILSKLEQKRSTIGL